MFEKLKEIEDRFFELERRMADPDVINDRAAYQQYSQEHAELAGIVDVYGRYKSTSEELETSKELLDDNDPEMKALAREEVETLQAELATLEEQLKKLLTPKDPNDSKNVLIEIRAGTGGEEAALFANDLFRMYWRYAEAKNWKTEVMSSHETGTGGFKEVVFMVYGKGAYSYFKFESGIHRVQRVPETETQGRIHTSAVTVAVLPEAEEVELHIDPSDVKTDVYRSSGPGGQSVNTTDSAVRLTHLPTGVVVTCQDEKSQLKNKAKAMKVLRARLLDKMVQEQNEKIAQERKGQVGTGDRSGRIRTYNFPQGRVTDHRAGITLYKLDTILQGEMDELLDKLATYFNAQQLKEPGAGDAS
ncbi:MAG: peptide chain release factor 1 [Thermodesulfobacteriota bacterium]|nr:peptide chain release factor 1 [Thermodesulfobacteriota bacterium]